MLNFLDFVKIKSFCDVMRKATIPDVATHLKEYNVLQFFDKEGLKYLVTVIESIFTVNIL